MESHSKSSAGILLPSLQDGTKMGSNHTVIYLCTKILNYCLFYGHNTEKRRIKDNEWNKCTGTRMLIRWWMGTFYFSYPLLVLHKRKKKEKKFSFFLKKIILIFFEKNYTLSFSFLLTSPIKERIIVLIQSPNLQAKSNLFYLFIFGWTSLPFLLCRI